MWFLSDARRLTFKAITTFIRIGTGDLEARWRRMRCHKEISKYSTFDTGVRPRRSGGDGTFSPFSSIIRSDATVLFCRNEVETIVRFYSSEIDAVQVNMNSPGGKAMKVRLYDDVLSHCSSRNVTKKFTRRRDCQLISTEWPNKWRDEIKWESMNSDDRRGLKLHKKIMQNLDLEPIKMINKLNFLPWCCTISCLQLSSASSPNSPNYR